MKPRFSILASLAVTALFGTFMGALCYPESAWGMIYWLGCLAVMLHFAIAAATTRDPEVKAASVATILCILCYLLLSRSEVEDEDYPLPHAWLAQHISTLCREQTTGPAWQPGTPGEPSGPAWQPASPGDPFDVASKNNGWIEVPIVDDERLSLLLRPTAAIGLGLLGGCLTAWRYRVLERREKLEKSE